jgi:hypothetical protein
MKCCKYNFRIFWGFFFQIGGENIFDYLELIRTLKPLVTFHMKRPTRNPHYTGKISTFDLCVPYITHNYDIKSYRSKYSHRGSLVEINYWHYFITLCIYYFCSTYISVQLKQSISWPFGWCKTRVKWSNAFNAVPVRVISLCVCT